MAAWLNWIEHQISALTVGGSSPSAVTKADFLFKYKEFAFLIPLVLPENKGFKDKKVFDSVEIRIIAEQNDLILTNNMKVVKFDETATPKFTDIDTHEMKTPFVGNDKALDELVQEAIFPYLVLTVEAASGEVFKNDLASICNDPKVKLEQKAEGEAFKAILEIDSAISNVDLSKLNAFEGSKQVLDANGNIIDTVSTVGFDATKDISFKIQVKFRGYEIEHKGSARVAV